MDDLKEKNTTPQKIKETRIVLFLPLLITAICAYFDLFFTNSHNILDVLKTIYTYIFPSIISSIITLCIQKGVYGVDSSGIADGKIFPSTLITTVYCIIYLSCLNKWCIISGILLGVVSIIYIIIIWVFCLDGNITHKTDPMEKETKALKNAVKKQNMEEAK